jgi:excisionase family DNA binding protein
MTLDELKSFPGAVLTIQEAASTLRVDTKTVSRAIEEERILTFPLGGRKKLILKQPFIEMLESGQIGPESLA